MEVSHRILLPRRVALQEGRDALDRSLQMLRALPLAQRLDIGCQLDDLLADYLRVRRVVARHDQQRSLALAHKFAVDAECEVAAEHVVAKVVQDVLFGLGALFADALRPSLHQIGEDVAIVGMAYRVLQHSRGNPARGELAQRQAEGGADAAAHDMKPVEPEMVGKRQVIGRVDMPVVARKDRGARAAGIALVHRDDPVFLAQYGHRIQPNGSSRWVRRAVPPEGELRAQPTRREDHQRKAAHVHLVINLAVPNVKYRHPVPPWGARTGPRTRGWDSDSRDGMSCTSREPLS